MNTKYFKYILSVLLLFGLCGSASATRIELLGTNSVADNFTYQELNNIELYAIADDVTAAMDGEASLAAKITSLDAAIAALLVSNGSAVSSGDTTPGYLYGTDGTDGKVRVGEGLDIAKGNAGADEYITLSGEDATITNKGIASFPTAQFTVTAGAVAIKTSSETVSGALETATDAEAVARTETAKAIVPSNLLEVFKFKEYYLIPIEWAEDGVTSTAEASALYTSTNGKVRAREFASDSTEDVVFVWVVPDDIVAASGIKFKVKCLVTEATGPSAEGVAFLLSGYSSGAGESINGTFGTAVESTATGRTDAQYDVFDTTLSGTVTATGLAAGELAMFKLERDHDHASDTYGQNLGVVSVTIVYTAYKAAP